MPIFMKVDGIVEKPAAQPYPGANAFVIAIRKAYPRGVGLLVIGQSAKEKTMVGRTSDGIIAILIGLLLPAVQKMHDGAHGDLPLLKGALSSTGQLGIVLADGSVRPVGGLAGRQIDSVFHTITWT